MPNTPLAQFLDTTSLKYTPDYTGAYLKSASSKNITIEEWNAIILQTSEFVQRLNETRTGFQTVLDVLGNYTPKASFEDLQRVVNAQILRIDKVIADIAALPIEEIQNQLAQHGTLISENSTAINNVLTALNAYISENNIQVSSVRAALDAHIASSNAQFNNVNIALDTYITELDELIGGGV